MSDRPARVEFIKSDDNKHKLVAIFYSASGRRIRMTRFGAAGYSDYTIHKNPMRKARYIARHSATENWADMTAPGTLSLYILWNKPSLEASIVDYKKRFKLN